jgi:hypothetical protein
MTTRAGSIGASAHEYLDEPRNSSILISINAINIWNGSMMALVRFVSISPCRRQHLPQQGNL